MSMLGNALKNLKGSTVQSSPKIATGSALQIVKLLGWKQVNDSGFAAVIDLKNADPALPDQFRNGQQVTYGDLLKYKLENHRRPNGTTGNHYPVIFSLSMAQADTIITDLNLCPKKGQSFKGKAAESATPTQNVQNADGVLAQQVSELRDGLMAVMEHLTQSATPTEGHSIDPQPAKPVEPVYVDLAPGQIVRVNGELRQLSADGKRLNKTID